MNKETRIALGLVAHRMAELEEMYGADMDCLDALDRDSMNYETDAIEILTRMLQTKVELRTLGTAIGTVDAANMEDER